MTETIQRESMHNDVLIVGAGPRGARRHHQIKTTGRKKRPRHQRVRGGKGSEVGAHIPSGAVIDPKALSELLPDWQAQGAPLARSVAEDRTLLLTEQKAVKLPTPPSFENHGNYIISLGALTRWLAEQAEALGVEYLSRLCRFRSALPCRRLGERHRHRRYGFKQRWHAQ